MQKPNWLLCLGCFYPPPLHPPRRQFFLGMPPHRSMCLLPLSMDAYVAVLDRRCNFRDKGGIYLMAVLEALRACQ
jgi:hypothetical protein